MHEGAEIETEGDSFFCAFGSAPEALRATAAQRADARAISPSPHSSDESRLAKA